MWWQWYGQGITPAIRWFCELVAMVTKLCFWQVSFSITRCPSKLQFHVYERVVIQLVHSVTWCILYFFDRYWWTCFILMMWRHQWKQRLVKRKKQLTAFTISSGFEPGRAIVPIPHCNWNCPLKKWSRGQFVPFKI